jgi:hypothetical protein
MRSQRDRPERITGIVILIFILICIYCVPGDVLAAETCPFMMIFHTPCPLCGISRSIYYTARGNFSLACSFHPAGIFLFFILISALPVLSFYPLYRRVRSWNAATGFLRHFALGAGIAVILAGILRRVPWCN